MFTVSGRTIRLSRGDTGIIPFRVDGVNLTDKDRCVFTVKRRAGAVLIQKVIEPEENVFYVPFVNDETDGWKEGEYSWDIRIALDAVLDAEGKVTDGREIITPWAPGKLEVIKVVGEI